MCGDFNSRTNTEIDFITYDSLKYINSIDYVEDEIMHRNYALGDLTGKPTSYSDTGNPI